MKNKRERALQIADNVIGRLEDLHVAMPSSQELLAYALVMVLADISERLEDLGETLGVIYTDGVGVG